LTLPPVKSFYIPKNYMEAVGKFSAPILGPVFLLLDAKMEAQRVCR